MEMQRFEELNRKVMEIAKRAGLICPAWVSEELGISYDEAFEVLDALAARGDLRHASPYADWFRVKKPPVHFRPKRIKIKQLYFKD